MYLEGVASSDRYLLRTEPPNLWYIVHGLKSDSRFAEALRVLFQLQGVGITPQISICFCSAHGSACHVPCHGRLIRQVLL